MPTPWRPADAGTALGHLLDLLAGTVARSPRSATLALNTIPLPHEFTTQLDDRHSPRPAGVWCREGNIRLLHLAEQYPGGWPAGHARRGRRCCRPAHSGRFLKRCNHAFNIAWTNCASSLTVGYSNTMPGGRVSPVAVLRRLRNSTAVNESKPNALNE